MKGYNVYSKVHQMREAGFSQRATAKALGINRKTVKRYWNMDVDEYEYNARKIVRIRNLDVLWSSFFVTLLAKKYHYSIMQLPLLHAG